MNLVFMTDKEFKDDYLINKGSFKISRPSGIVLVVDIKSKLKTQECVSKLRILDNNRVFVNYYDSDVSVGEYYLDIVTQYETTLNALNFIKSKISVLQKVCGVTLLAPIMVIDFLNDNGMMEHYVFRLDAEFIPSSYEELNEIFYTYFRSLQRPPMAQQQNLLSMK